MRTFSPSRPPVNIRRRKNCSENETSNWTPGGHIRTRGDGRRTGWTEERGDGRERMDRESEREERDEEGRGKRHRNEIAKSVTGADEVEEEMIGSRDAEPR